MLKSTYNVCILVDKFFTFGGGEIFLEDLLKNTSDKLNFKYLISIEKPLHSYQDPISMPIEILDYNEENIKRVSFECDFLLFWGRVLDSVKHFSLKKVMWAHSDYNVRFFLEGAENYTDHYIACSTSVKNAINKKKCTIIFPGLDASRYEEPSICRRDFRKILGFQENDFIIGQFCRFAKFKNIPFLINAISMIKDPNVKALLIGHGKELVNIIELCENKIPKRFQHLYYADVGIISNFYNCLDAFCLASDGEGYARVQWESAMFKVPFIGTNVGGVVDGIIDNFNGFIIKEEKQLREIIEKIKDLDTKDKIISNAYDLFLTEGHISKTVFKIEKLFEELFDNRKKFYV